MAKTKKPAAREASKPASRNVVRAVRHLEDTPPASTLQVARLVRRFALPATLAAVVAEHAFTTREAAR